MASSSPPSWKQLLLQTGVIVVVTLWVFWPAVHGQWIGDDRLYITSNPLLYEPDRLWKAWFQPGSFVEYYPIEETVQWLQWKLWHDDTFGYHLTNILLHITSALLVWRLFSKLSLRFAWVGGLLFAVHPTLVESVALINEFKACLSLPPFLLAMCAWIDFVEKRKSRDYGLALLFFIIAMLCKITMAMFPIVILLYAWWKRGRIGWNDLKASVPFFIVSLALGLTSMHAATVHDGPLPAGVGPDFSNNILWRLILAGETIFFYIFRSLWPGTPLPVYPQWKVDLSSPVQYLPLLALAIGLFFLWKKRATWGRHALLGLVFFLIMLSPFFGLNWISYMEITWTLDHLLYIPIIGLVGLVVAGMGQMDHCLSPSLRRYGIGIVTVVILSLTFTSHSYAGKFINEETLCRYTIQYFPGSWSAHNNLGINLQESGRYSEAIGEHEKVIILKPDYPAGYYNLGCDLKSIGQLSEAVEQYQAAIRLEPNYALAYYNLGNTLLQMRHTSEAIDSYQQALKIDPGYASARNNLGNVLAQSGHLAEAISQYQQVLLTHPRDDQARYNLGNAFFQSGRFPEAIEQYQSAVQLRPDFAEAYNHLGMALAQAGQIPDAIRQFEIALRLNPRDDSAGNNLMWAESLLQSTPKTSR